MGPPRVKAKSRLVDRRAERCVFSMGLFAQVAAEVAASSAQARALPDHGDARVARAAVLGGDGLGYLAALEELRAAASLSEQTSLLQKMKAGLKSSLMGPVDPVAPVDISKVIYEVVSLSYLT
jgi:hypothetical protein